MEADTTKLSELTVENLADMIPGIIIVYNVNSGKFVYTNQAVKTILGYKPEDFLKKGMDFVASLIHPDDLHILIEQNLKDLKRANSAMRKKDGSTITTIRYRIKHANGSWVWLRTEGSVYNRNTKGLVEHIITVSLNVTDQKELQLKLERLSETLKKQVHDRGERLELAQSASHMGLWDWDFETGKITGSPQLLKLLGLPLKYRVSTIERYKSTVHPRDKKHVEAIINLALETGQEYSLEHRVIWPDKSVHWMLTQGRAYLKKGLPIRLVGTTTNIDDIKEKEKVLRETENRLRRVADSVPAMIWMAELDKNRVYFNKPWLEFTGKNLSDQIGDRWKKNIHPNDIDKVKRVYNQAFNKKKLYGIEYRLLRNDGKYRWILEKGAPYYSKNGKFEGFIGTSTDIETMKRATERKRKLESKNTLLKAERSQLIAINEAKDEFISLASHQLRTPATAVKQYVGMLLEGYVEGLSDYQKNILQKAYESNERQIKTINDLLLVASIDSGEIKLTKQHTNISQILQDVANEHLPSINERNQSLSLHITNNLYAFVDPDYIRMVFDNIVDNAHKYTYESGKILIETTKKKSNIEVTIKDSGYGIRKSDRPKLYQKFSRLQNHPLTSIEGNGIGLYWSKRIVELHEGLIKLTSRPGKGSAFIIQLPANDSSTMTKVD